MRKVTQEIIKAFRNKEKRSIGNSSTYNGELFLHGNLIAKWLPDGNLGISHCGWHSNTTKERLNGLPNVSIYQKNYQWFLNWQKWSTLSAVISCIGEVKQLDERL